MPQTLRTLLLTCLAWFMPLHALDATTGQWHPAEAIASGSAAPDGAEGPAPVDVTAAIEPPAAPHVTLQATGLRLQRVLATRARPADDVHTLTVRSADGTLQSIRGTADHPVYVQGGDTFEALATLRPGDAARALDGRPSTVAAVTPDPGLRTVHNLTVEFTPTYFVDAEVREGWGGIWVHNSCYANQYPERLEEELANAARAGVVPIGPGDRRFNAVLGQGTINWAVLQNGDLVVSPSNARGIPMNHSILSGGAPVLAAGQAEISVGGGLRYASEINNNSGHFRPGAESLEIGRQAFERAGVTIPSGALRPHVP